MSRKILILDDNADDALILQQRLEPLHEGALAECSYQTAATIAQGIAAVEAGGVDLVFLDYTLGLQTGDAFLVQRTERNLSVPVIVMTGASDVYVAAELTRLGAEGFLSKDDEDSDRLREVVERVLQDAAEQRTRNAAVDDVRQRLEQLTPRETEVLEYLLEGRTSKEVAETLHRSMETIKVHRAHILQKMDVGSTAELIRLISTTTGNVR